MKIKIMQLNVRSIKSNYEEIKQVILEYKFDIVMLQETWLSKKDSPLKFPGYIVYETRRKLQTGGGVAILVTHQYKSNKIHFNDINETTPIDIVGTELYVNSGEQQKQSSKCTIKFVSIYVPPITKPEELSSIGSIDWHNMVIAGDFNAHTKDWSHIRENPRGHYIKDLIKHKNLKIKIPNESTFISNSSKSNSNPDFMIFDSNINIKNFYMTTHEPISFCDHLPIFYSFNAIPFVLNKTEKKVIWEWGKANKTLIKEKLYQLYSKLKTKNIIENPSKTYHNLICAIQHIISECVPNHVTEGVTLNSNRKPTPWWNEEIKKLIKLRNIQWKKSQNGRSLIHKFEYDRLRKIIKEKIKDAKENFWSQNNFESNIKTIFTRRRISQRKFTKVEVRSEQNNKLNQAETLGKFFSEISGGEK